MRHRVRAPLLGALFVATSPAHAEPPFPVVDDPWGIHVLH